MIKLLKEPLQDKLRSPAKALPTSSILRCPSQAELPVDRRGERGRRCHSLPRTPTRHHLPFTRVQARREDSPSVMGGRHCQGAPAVALVTRIPP